jgi:hypothetical protein
MQNGELTAGFLSGVFMGTGYFLLLASATHALIAEPRISQILDDKMILLYILLSTMGFAVETKG